MKVYPKTVTVNGQPYVSALEAARILDVHFTKVYMHIRSRRFSCVRRLGYRYIPKAEIAAYAARADSWLRAKGRPVPRRRRRDLALTA